MTTYEIKRSIAQSVTQHTLIAAISTLNCYGDFDVTAELQADLLELQKLEQSQLVDAAIKLVTIGLRHAINPITETYDLARIARDNLGDLLMSAKEIKG